MHQGKQCVTQGLSRNRPKGPPTEQGQGTPQKMLKGPSTSSSEASATPGRGEQEKSGLWGSEGGHPPGSQPWNSGMAPGGRDRKPCFQSSLLQPPISTQHLPWPKPTGNQRATEPWEGGVSPWDIECPCYHVLYPKCSHSQC